jgi:transposase
MIPGEPSEGGFQMNRHGLRDDQFARIEMLLPGRPGYVGRDSDLGNRLFVESVIWKFRTGVPWRDMPALRSLEEHTHAFLTLGDQRGLGESFQIVGG